MKLIDEYCKKNSIDFDISEEIWVWFSPSLKAPPSMLPNVTLTPAAAKFINRIVRFSGLPAGISLRWLWRAAARATRFSAGGSCRRRATVGSRWCAPVSGCWESPDAQWHHDWLHRGPRPNPVWLLSIPTRKPVLAVQCRGSAQGWCDQDWDQFHRAQTSACGCPLRRFFDHECEQPALRRWPGGLCRRCHWWGGLSPEVTALITQAGKTECYSQKLFMDYNDNGYEWIPLIPLKL